MLSDLNQARCLDIH